MKPFHCPRSIELGRAQAPLSRDLELHLAICDLCRETWLVASAMRSLVDATSDVATTGTDVTRILMLAEVAAEKNRERRYRLLVGALFVSCLLAWTATVALGTGHGLPEEAGSVIALLTVAIGAVLWSSSESTVRSVARR